MIEDLDGVLVPRSSLAPLRGRQTRLDGCAVPTAALADVLSAFIEKVSRSTVVALPGSRGSGSHKSSPAVEWLAEQTRRYDPTGRGVQPTVIERIMSERGREREHLTQLRTADVLLTACGATPFIYTEHGGTLPIRENPKASASARAACCAGSREAMESLTGGFSV